MVFFYFLGECFSFFVEESVEVVVRERGIWGGFFIGKIAFRVRFETCELWIWRSKL